MSHSEEGPFWETTSLSDMTRSEWEALCDGCGKCCLHKFIDDDTAEDSVYAVSGTDTLYEGEHVHFTNIVCDLLNTKTCACSDYQNRTVRVPDCVQLTQQNLDRIFYMPPSCSYRRLHEGRGLPSWHPLLNRSKKTAMHKAGMSVRGKTVNENDVDLDEFHDYIALWPLEDID
ncbi:YcgN family cysteine cluster protein [Alteromonas oceanisediminis]|uniref:YcgN family cysteine cluster protein n=1 Tax=Alteromonas oceanisediminis TaxID=2836180 RepID=UPI001BDAA823|nr:YcgN family cysteine cluster protein [Alteromonas oceanisediminis]MBT0587456.1 YcgN family cysteine cluster protein [Alteromonas oceanisediminis]